jgi:hypothetical protein
MSRFNEVASVLVRCDHVASVITGAEFCAAQKLETGWLLAQALRSQPAQLDSVWQLVRVRERRRPPNQRERTR